MKLFSRKKSNSAIRDQQEQKQAAPPNISRPRAQGHLPPTTGPRQSSSSTARRSFSSGPTPLGTEPVTTPLYARFARADSLENLSLNLRGPADSRSPSFAPTQSELEDGASRLGYDRPWAQETLGSLDNVRTLPEPPKPRVVETPKPAPTPRPMPEPPKPAPAPPASSNGAERSRSPLAPGAGPTLRMVSSPLATSTDRKSTADKRMSIDAMVAADPFMASKMQSVLRRAPSNNNPPASPTVSKTQNPVPVPSRSSTAPPPPTTAASRPTPAPRAPTAPPAPPSTSTPPSRSVSNSRASTISRGPPPASQNYRPSMDGGMSSDDGHSTFSHSNAGHSNSNRPIYPSTNSNSAVNRNGNGRERGPPPVAGTPSAYAWRSGQSDDGHGGSSNFYTGGSQSQPQTQPFPLPAGLPPLPPGALPPQLNPGMPPMASVSTSEQRKRTPSNPPVSRVPYHGPGAKPTNGIGGRRMSIDATSANSNLALGLGMGVGGGPGTWGGTAPGPEPYQQRAYASPPPPPAPIPVPGAQDLGRRMSRSVQPGEIFHHHPQVQVGARRLPSAPGPAPGVGMGPGPGPAPGVQDNGMGGYQERGRAGPIPAPARLVSSPQQQQKQADERHSPAKSSTPTDVNTRQAGPFKGAAANDGGRQSPFKVEERQSVVKSEGQGASKSEGQSSFKSEGRQSPVKPSPLSSSPPRSMLSVDTSNSSKTVMSPSPARSTTLSPSPVPIPVPVPVPTSPAQTIVSASSYRSALSPATTVAGTPFTSSNPSLYATPAQTTISSSPGAFQSPIQSPDRAPSSASSYGTAMPLDSEAAFDMGPTASRLALGGAGATLAPINTTQVRRSPSPGLPATPRDRVPPLKTESHVSSPTGTAMTARMTPTTPSRGIMTPNTPARSTPIGAGPLRNGFRVPSPVPPAEPTQQRPSTAGEMAGESSDGESMHSKKRNLLVKTRKMEGASSFRTSEERSESGQAGQVGDVDASPRGPGMGLDMADDPFARAPPTIVKSVKKAKIPLTPDTTPDPNVHTNGNHAKVDGDTTPRRALPLSPPLSADDDHEPTNTNAGLGLGIRKPNAETELITPALTDNETEIPSMSEIADMSEGEGVKQEEEEEMEPESTTPPGSPPPPKVYPLATHLAMPSLLHALLCELSFRDWNALNALNAGIRKQFEETRALREEVLEFWLRGVGYVRWTSHKRENLSLSLRDLNAYMRGVSIAVYRYSAIAESFLAVRAQQEKTAERVPGAASKGNLVRALASSCRAYTKVILRLREQAEVMREPGEFRSPLLRVGHAPLLRVFVPSKEGAWLSDASVLDCEKELKRAGALGALRVGDVVWDAAVGDEGNAGRMVWDGNYLVDLDYTYSTTGELPKYINSLAFPPAYWHKVIRTSNSPLCHIDLAPYAAEIAQNLQLVQDRVQTETPQGGRHTVVRWVHRSRFHPRPGTVIPNSKSAASPTPNFVDRMWEGLIVVEVEGTNEGLADLQARCGPQVRLFPAKTGGRAEPVGGGLGKCPFRLLRASSRPGEIWMRAVREKERLL